MSALTCDVETLSVPVCSSRRHPLAWMIGVVGPLCLVLFLYRLGDRELASSHEARAAQNAQSMLNSGDWTLPRLFDGRVEMQKPPLFYWLVALCASLNDGQVEAWCVRLPAALAALACVLLLLLWGHLRGRLVAGFLAAIVLATSLHFTTLARTGRIDMPLTFTVGVTLIGFVQGRELRLRRGGHAGWPWFLAAYVAIAAGVLLKGPIAVALPAAVLLLLALTSRIEPDSRRLRFRLRNKISNYELQWGIPLVLVLTLPWFLWAHFQTDGEWCRVFFWYHNVDRGLGTDEKLRAYPFWFYAPQLLLNMLPWSLLLPLAGWHLWRHKGDADARFGACWLLTMVLLLSCMRFKRADYLLPAFPGAAWLIGCALESWKPRRAVVATFAGATVALWLAYFLLVMPLSEEARTHRRFAEEVRRHTGDQVLFFRVESHLVAFHVGQPLATLLEWENLDIWAGRPAITYVLMQPEDFKEWRDYISAGELEVVARTEDLATSALPPWVHWCQFLLDTRERPLVLVRTHTLQGR